MLTRRSWITTCAASAIAQTPPRLVDAHVHFFDPQKFPYHPNATYQPPAERVEDYAAFARQAGITHTVIVHPEPYQDDHRYLDYCFTQEPSTTRFLGTCLLDALDPRTPARMKELKKRYSARLIAMRIHAMNAPGEAPLAQSPIKNRDLAAPALARVWATAGEIGIAIQMHFLPHHAPAIAKLAAAHPGTKVILDHLGRFGMGGPQSADQVLALAAYPNTVLKFSGWGYSSKVPVPHADLLPFMKRAIAGFGDRIVWGGLGHNASAHTQAKAVFDTLLAPATAAQRAAIRTAKALAI